MFEEVDFSRLVYCSVAFVVILAVQLSRMKLTPALNSGLIKADKENDGEFESYGSRQCAFNMRISNSIQRKQEIPSR